MTEIVPPAGTRWMLQRLLVDGDLQTSVDVDELEWKIKAQSSVASVKESLVGSALILLVKGGNLVGELLAAAIVSPR